MQEIPWATIALFSENDFVLNSLMLVSNHVRNTILQSDQVDQTIFQPIIEKFIINLGGNSKELLEHSPTCSFYEILMEFYNFPFKFSNFMYTDDEYANYKNNGGVTMIYKCEPCELMEIVLKKVNESSLLEFHKILVALSILQDEDYNEITPLSVKLSADSNTDKIPITYGKLFMKLLKDLKYCEISNESEMKVQFNLIPKFKPKKMKLNPSNDIFKLCENPPYGIRNKNSFNLSEIRSNIYGDYKEFETFNWVSHLESSWSSYWQAGEEWWGIHAHSSYSPIRNLFIIAFASASD